GSMLPSMFRLHASTCQRLIRLSIEGERNRAYLAAKRRRAVILTFLRSYQGRVRSRVFFRNYSGFAQDLAGVTLRAKREMDATHIQLSTGAELFPRSLVRSLEVQSNPIQSNPVQSGPVRHSERLHAPYLLTR